MKQYLVFSDSHGHAENMNRVFEKMKDETAGVIFLGDGERDFDVIWNKSNGIDTYRVSGNCDWNGKYAKNAVITIEGHKILITHGAEYGHTAHLELLTAAARENNCEAALFGHTHVRFKGKKNGILLMNPGSISVPRDGLPPSFGLILADFNCIRFRIESA